MKPDREAIALNSGGPGVHPEPRRPGGLVLVGTPIGNLGDLAPRAVEALRSVDVIACEDTRRTRVLLSAMDIPGGNRLVAVHAHNEAKAAANLVRRMEAGDQVAYVTDAGMPGISDPGERLVRLVVAAGLPVSVIPGPSAALSALVLSGLPTGRFAFEGFLPRKGPERAARLAAVAADQRSTLIFEAPNRLAATLADLAEICGPAREVAVARELTKTFETVWRGPLSGAIGDGPDTPLPRGEQVIVVGPAPPPPSPGLPQIEAALQAELAMGASVRDAAMAVAERLGIGRNEVYDLAVAVKKGTAHRSGETAPASGPE